MTEMPLDPGMLRFNDELAAHTPPESAGWPLARQREVWNGVCRLFRAPMPAGIAVEDHVLGGVPAQVYRPEGAGLRPGVLYSHGGGWVLGGPDTHGDMCAEIAAATGCVVVLVDYRLAPEHRHPAQLDDVAAVLAALRRDGAALGIDPARIVGAGDSAGGQLTAGLSLRLRDQGQARLSGQVLIYPALDVDMTRPSYIRNADAPCLTRADMTYYLESFLGPRGGANWSDPQALPLRAESLAGLPPAFITVAGHDPLCDDGVAFHERLIAAGVASELRREPALAHSYMRARHVSAPAMAGFAAIAGAITAFAHGG